VSEGGSALRTGRSMRIWTIFSDVYWGAPALVDWVRSRGGTNLRYELSNDFDDR
jgi:hypothetical protein